MQVHLRNSDSFESRHNGSWERHLDDMLQQVGASSLDQLIDQTVPSSIRLQRPLQLPDPKTEHRFLAEFEALVDRNQIFTSFIGLGYHNTITPAVIRRNILENPAWYTAYTPYQPEIAQGRLEALINFQTMVMELTGMEIANASLLDEATAAAEAMTMLFALRKGSRSSAATFLVDPAVHPQTIDVLRSRARHHDIILKLADGPAFDPADPSVYGMLLQYPNSDGRVVDYAGLIARARDNGVAVAIAADLLSLCLLRPPGEMGADVVVGSTQRFGVPMGYGGPHAAYFATRDQYKRQVPGRIIGASIDREGRPAFRMALQTREQHIRREKATSNICTAQVLLAVMAGMYAVYHGPEGLRAIAGRIHGMAAGLEAALLAMGYEQANEAFFDTLRIRPPMPEISARIRSAALDARINFRYFDNGDIGIAIDEGHSLEDLLRVALIFAEAAGSAIEPIRFGEQGNVRIPESLRRISAFLQHRVFEAHHSEHEMLRYIRRLESRDLSLVHSMIPLGSCTMKLNATTEMIPVTWPKLANLHPFAPVEQAEGYRQLFSQLEGWLNEITGFSATSLQPNSGAQGEYAGLMVIRAYHEHRGEGHRNITLIPSSAHGTNPASAVMAGMEVVIVGCDEHGNIDLADLRQKAEQHRERLAALMVTYPSTHGVFEEGIVEICRIVHECGGQVYMDGANMNAQVGLTSPARIGADVCHLNLHKTFCIPHGGGGPGVGPICAAAHLADFLPGNPLVPAGGQHAINAVSAAPWGSAGILAISYAYISMMGPEGLTMATRLAILNANYIKSRLEGHYKILYSGKHGRCAHEMIVDCRDFKRVGVEVEDIAKRLMDYGFHAPTVSFPVAGTLMVEPTESESKAELDRFCDALIEIRGEIAEIEQGLADPENNLLKNAPHTASMAVSEHWNKPYSREKAFFPLPYVRESKFWPAVARIDSAYGDRNLVCSCQPIEDYVQQHSLSI
jgi:glycine dehydrogenase